MKDTAVCTVQETEAPRELSMAILRCLYCTPRSLRREPALCERSLRATCSETHPRCGGNALYGDADATREMASEGASKD